MRIFHFRKSYLSISPGNSPIDIGTDLTENEVHSALCIRCIRLLLLLACLGAAATNYSCY